MANFLTIKTKGFDTFREQIKNSFEQRVMKPAEKSILQSSDDVAFIAQEMAPRKTGTLESSIEARPNVDRTPQTITGEVWVRGTAYNPVDGVRVSEYRMEAHEEITPAGNKKLGPGSVAKNASILGKYDDVGVGGWFLTRALDYMRNKITTRLKNAIREGLLRS